MIVNNENLYLPSLVAQQNNLKKNKNKHVQNQSHDHRQQNFNYLSLL